MHKTFDNFSKYYYKFLNVGSVDETEENTNGTSGESFVVTYQYAILLEL